MRKSLRCEVDSTEINGIGPATRNLSDVRIVNFDVD